MINLIIWMNLPSHHQAQFFDILSVKVNNFRVNYYSQVSSERSEMGWDNNIKLKPYEQFIDPFEYHIDIQVLKEYIHILPGYGHPFLIKLRNEFSKNGIQWIHWSEKSRPSFIWYLSYLKKFTHARKVNKYALGALAIGKQAKKDFEKWSVEDKKIAILPYSFSEMLIKQPDQQIINYKQSRNAFLFVGALCHRKGVDLLLKAFAKNFKGDKNWCLILVGNKKADLDCEKLIKTLKITDQVFLRGVISSSEIISAYIASDVFILPSRHDGWGMVVNEALYCSLPIIVSDAVGASDHLVANNVNGFVFKSECVNELAQAMAQYKNPSLVQQHSSNSKLFFEKFNSESMANHLINTIKKWQDHEDFTGL